MKKIILSTTALMIMSIDIYAENNQTITYTSMDEVQQQPVQARSVRGILGEYDTAIHAKGQLRAGYITFQEDGATRTSAYALGGHFHFDTKRWNGLMVGAAAYTVLDLGINQNPDHVNPDFFDDKGKSFIILSKAFIDGKWGNTEIKLGRQTLDTPLADSDDIRMIPNFFQAYTLINTDIDHLTLTAGFIDRMAGWENGVDASRFVNIGEVLGTEKIDGIAYASASYDGIENLSMSLWYYHYDDIANILYAEAGYELHLLESVDLTFGLQFGGTHETGEKLLGVKDGHAYGISMEAGFSDTGITLLAAYNKGTGSTGATDLSLGGGPFFTSMEDQTIDAIGGKGYAWMTALGYDMSHIGLSGFSGGIAYGLFKTDRAAGHYHASETDVVLDYNPDERFSITAALALVDHKDDGLSDFDQFRLIGSYSF
jgi:hypothetical protein